MYLTVRNTRGNRYLLLMESVHVPGKRAPNKRVIKNFGNYDKLPEEIRRQYEDAKAKKELAKRLEQQARNSALSDALHADSQENQPCRRRQQQLQPCSCPVLRAFGTQRHLG